MSDEQTTTLEGQQEGSVTPDVAPAQDEQVVTEEEKAKIDAAIEDDSVDDVPQPEDVVPAAEPVAAEAPVEESASTPVEGEEIKIFYNGQEVVGKLDEVNGDGRLCTLADGTTAFVPLAILGE